METQLAYCAAVDRRVRVAADVETGSWPDAVTPDPHELVCLEYGESCTGTFCPVFQIPVETMRRNYLRVVGMPDDPGEA